METPGHGRLAIPYPLWVPEPIVVDEPNVRIAIRGLAATLDEISFVVQIVVVGTDEDDGTRGAALSGGVPFNVPHETPDPEALTVRCRWLLAGDLGFADDTDWANEWGGGPLEQGSWRGGLDTGVWQGFFILRYPIPVSKIESFTIALSWNRLGINEVQRVTMASALEEALAFAAG